MPPIHAAAFAAGAASEPTDEPASPVRTSGCTSPNAEAGYDAMTVIACPEARLVAPKRDGSPAEPVQGVVEPVSPWKHSTFVEAAGALTVTDTRSRSVVSLAPKTL